MNHRVLAIGATNPQKWEKSGLLGESIKIWNILSKTETKSALGQSSRASHTEIEDDSQSNGSVALNVKEISGVLSQNDYDSNASNAGADEIEIEVGGKSTGRSDVSNVTDETQIATKNSCEQKITKEETN